ncbi:type VI secretion system baseplate subunit TssG (plasmid) [Skermanella rosea]|uniref:type VI secretion system baseplate subunit TssG n=1 Tax=Skermanella rosea TaxID=1817965 RepID=UPI001934A6EB|nr:type VI secretion system baseplate subunit TssG [Skermanella rosea]UEM07580.1 type VI secretion system baseplate subunit TssG [Skermanella rosea]
MADETRAPAAGLMPIGAVPPAHEALSEILREANRAPEKFDFFALLRRIDASSTPGPRIGESRHPEEDPVRLGQSPSTIFPPRALESVGPDGGHTRIMTFFFGLFGPNGPLPLHLTEYAHQRLHNAGDEAFACFADIFHHRMASLLFRAWAASEPTVSHDRPGEDGFAARIGALAGYGMPELRGRDGMPDLAKLHFAGRLGSHTRNAEGLQAILSAFYSMPVTIREFDPKWVEIAPGQRLALGADPENGTLGVTATVGRRIRLFYHRFRIVMGPLTLAEYERLLPGGESVGLMVPLVRNYVGDELDWTLGLILRADQVPKLKLGHQGRLGWTTWLGRRPDESDAGDLMLAPLNWEPP